MALEEGAVLGHYEILALVGKGGMGEVYKARDTRLGRSVAIKVIDPALADRADVQRRFEQEGRLTATLDHPRICAVHDVGQQDGILYLVMEFLDGESLAMKTARGPLPRSEVLGYAIEIASAVHHAHRRGVIHRDLKPGNVFITPTGVKVLDFGLAKLRHADGPPIFEDAGEHTPPPRTVEGSVLGTPHYLPPERLEGKLADQRSDTFAFGEILYEMAAGRRAFDAPSSAALIAAILTTDPPPLPPEAGAADLEWVVRRCLAKNPDDRWQSMGDVEAVLKWIAKTSNRGIARSIDAAPKSRLPLWVLLGCLLMLAIGAAEIVRRRNDGPRPALVALTMPPPAGGSFISTQGSVESPQLAMSPDGREIAFIAAGPDSEPQIWIRAINETAPRPLAGTEGATYPFWSPNGEALAFFVGGSLKRIDRRGGPARILAAAPNGRGGTWMNGVIIFAPNTRAALARVRDDGTDAADLTTLHDAGELGHRFPQFLPDGRHFIWFLRSTEPAKEGIYLGSLDSPERTLLVASGSSAQYTDPGRLLYILQGTLLAANLDLTSRRLTGDPVQVANDVATSSNFYSAFSAAGGVLAYGQRDPASDELVWVDKKGTRLGAAAARSRYVDFRISPDGRHVAVSAIDPKTDNTDINRLDLERMTELKLTASSKTDASPVWEPGGARLIFRSNRAGVHDLYTRPSSGAGADASFLKSPTGKYPTDWTRTGSILYHTNVEGSWGIFQAPAGKPGESRELLQEPGYNEVQGQVSPDERWIAYTSDESGRPEVYVQSLPNRASKLTVSRRGAPTAEWHGASDPRWRRDGRELFYVTATGEVMGVPIAVVNGTIDPGRPQHLFTIASAAIEQPYTSVYDVKPDGSRFLVRMQRGMLPISVLVNWTVP
ncbi:MAG: serine/threonine-protein kinase [Acidobacteriota bacterium]|nr:serine/threonine-protein kinase [Acidobacteriota bacterium]